jgi:small subunit ribosomal protein S14
MANKGKVVKVEKDRFKFEVQAYNRCSRCGRARGYYRFFGMCRICIRELAHKGELPGLRTASW